MAANILAGHQSHVQADLISLVAVPRPELTLVVIGMQEQIFQKGVGLSAAQRKPKLSASFLMAIAAYPVHQPPMYGRNISDFHPVFTLLYA